MFRLSLRTSWRGKWNPAEFIAFDTDIVLFERDFDRLRVLSDEYDAQNNTWFDFWNCGETFTVGV